MMKDFKIIKKLSAVILAISVLISLSACNLKETFCVHDFAETTVAATCKDEGTLTKTCRKCGYEKTKTLEKTAHTYDGEWTETVAATCQNSGKAERVCSVCGFKDEKILPKKDHDIVAGMTIEPTCTDKGYSLGVCKNCGKEEKGNYTPALGHDWGNWVEVTAASATKNGTMERECARCHKKETQTTVFYGYIDDSALSYDFNAAETPTVTSEEELQTFYKAALFNCAETATCNTTFTLTDKIVSNLKADYAGRNEVKFSYTSKSLTITASYGIPDNKTTATRQTQYASVNYYSQKSTRADSYEGFKINASDKTRTVTYTDQLYYVLERGYKPLPVIGSPAERVYEKMKAALREIISDDMSDFEKVRAIHDYLVMNVVYDNALYNLALSGASVKNYNGFYLEGVFDDKIAVCDGISKAFSAMANIEGIPCVRITGKKSGSTGSVGHAWNKVLINNKWYIADATSDNVILTLSGGKQHEVLSLEYFLITDAEMSESYEASDYAELKATTDYSARYTDNSFGVSPEKYDFIVDDDAELNYLINSALKLSGGGSVQFTLASEYSGNLDETVRKHSYIDLTPSGSTVYTYIFLK